MVAELPFIVFLILIGLTKYFTMAFLQNLFIEFGFLVSLTHQRFAEGYLVVTESKLNQNCEMFQLLTVFLVCHVQGGTLSKQIEY